MVYDVVVIGSGPAGLSAAIYTARAQLSTFVLSGLQPGGQLTTTTDVENFPGFSKGISGSGLMQEMKVQAERFGTKVLFESATAIKPSRSGFSVTTKGGLYDGKAVIIATGASAMYLGLASEQTFFGRGVSACATCDGFFFKGKDVVVVGGGDTAMEEALFLSKLASRVTIIHRREGFRASPIMLTRAKKNSKISFLTNKVIEEIVGDTHVTGVRMKDVTTGKVEMYATQGVFLAIGHRPNTEFLKGTVDLDEKGYVKVTGTATSVRGIFAAGDCVDFKYRQAAVAAGMGVMAALDVQKYLESV